MDPRATDLHRQEGDQEEAPVGVADVVGPTAQGIDPGQWGELVAAIRAGHTYVNIHTTRWPGGEIRGQVNDDDQRETRK